MSQNQNQKNEFISSLLEDFAVLHNIAVHDAAKMKNIHNILLGVQNALESDYYKELTFEEFKENILKDINDIYKNQ